MHRNCLNHYWDGSRLIFYLDFRDATEIYCVIDNVIQLLFPSDQGVIICRVVIMISTCKRACRRTISFTLNIKTDVETNIVFSSKTSAIYMSCVSSIGGYCKNTRACAWTHTRTHTRTHAHTHTRTHAHTHTRTHAHTHTRTHTHTQCSA